MGNARSWKPHPALADTSIRILIFLTWLGLVTYLVTQHAMFRDEVRAYSLAVQGSNPIQMLHLLRGEGHPAVWYLLLRGAHALIPTPHVLPGLALLVTATAVALLVFLSRLPWPLLAALLCTHFILFEYAVIARNYGITMLLLFLLALAYPKREQYPLLIGTLLFLTANTNVHAVILAGCFALFLALEVLVSSGWQAAFASRSVRAACIGVALGTVCCYLMVRAPFNDAAQVDLHQHALTIIRGFLLPGSSFSTLVPNLWNIHPQFLWNPLFSLILVGSTLILFRSPGACAAALAALFSLSLLFTAVYSGRFRHEALWLVFLLTMYWIVRQQPTPSHTPAWLQRHGANLQRAGAACALFLLTFQIYAGIHRVRVALRQPESDSRAFAFWMEGHPEYQNAWVIADPDYLVETVRYYMSNPTYLIRERRPGSIVIFSRHAQLSLALSDIIQQAKTLHAQNGQPVLILLDATKLGQGEVATSYDWVTDESPAQASEFLAGAELLAKFPETPADEAFEVFTLR